VTVYSEPGVGRPVVQPGGRCSDGTQEDQPCRRLPCLGTWAVQHSSASSVYAVTLRQPQDRTAKHHTRHSVCFLCSWWSINQSVKKFLRWSTPWAVKKRATLFWTITSAFLGGFQHFGYQRKKE